MSIPKLVALVLLLTSGTVFAKSTNFACHGLSYSWFVTLDVSGKTAKGTLVNSTIEAATKTPGPTSLSPAK